MKVLSQKPELVEQEIALCLWIAEAGLPFHCFELDSFKTFCKSIGFAPRSPDTWSSSIIPSMAHVVENQNRTLLNSASSFALAVDGWSDNGKICGAVAHFITPDMECHRQIFSAEEIRANSTNELLSASLFAILQKNQLTKKLSALVTDNGDNYRMIANNLNAEGWSCCCHTLQLVVEDVMKGFFFSSRHFSFFFLSLSLFSLLSLSSLLIPFFFLLSSL